MEVKAKTSGRYGNKGVIGVIPKDRLMPKTKDGKTVSVQPELSMIIRDRMLRETLLIISNS